MHTNLECGKILRYFDFSNELTLELFQDTGLFIQLLDVVYGENVECAEWLVLTDRKNNGYEPYDMFKCACNSKLIEVAQFLLSFRNINIHANNDEIYWSEYVSDEIRIWLQSLDPQYDWGMHKHLYEKHYDGNYGGGGGLMQLVGYGYGDMFWVNRPITFYKVVYRRHDNITSDTSVTKSVGNTYGSRKQYERISNRKTKYKNNHHYNQNKHGSKCCDFRK